jgi:polyisoprenoid-binding protein YceI
MQQLLMPAPTDPRTPTGRTPPYAPTPVHAHVAQALSPAATGIPAPGWWLLDPARTTVTCSGRASRLAPTVRARFGVVGGHVAVAEDPGDSQLEVVVDLRSLTTGRAAWDQVLHAADPLGAATSPLATYRSSAIEWRAPGHAAVAGSLGLGDRAQGVSLTVRYDYEGEGVRLAATGDMAQPAAPVPGLSYLMPRRFTLDIRAFAIPAAV